MLLYSETLYWLYLNSAKANLVFLFALFAIMLFNLSYFKFEYKVLIALIAIYFVFDTIITIWVSFGKKDQNLAFNHPYTYFSFLLVLLFYFKFKKNKVIKYFILFSGILYTLLTAYQIITQYPLVNKPDYLILKNAIVVILCSYTYYNLTKVNTPLKNIPLFWFNLALLIINISNFVLKPLFELAIDYSDDLAFSIGIFINLIDPIFYVLLLIGVLSLRKNTKSISSLWLLQ
jgi:hypothetical protein